MGTASRFGQQRLRDFALLQHNINPCFSPEPVLRSSIMFRNSPNSCRCCLQSEIELWREIAVVAWSSEDPQDPILSFRQEKVYTFIRAKSVYKDMSITGDTGMIYIFQNITAGSNYSILSNHLIIWKAVAPRTYLGSKYTGRDFLVWFRSTFPALTVW